jgi:putative DNA primase/helicase
MINEFRQVVESAGLMPGEILPDVERQRCPVRGGKPGSLDGAYGFFSDEPMSGWWQNWKTGEKGKWTAGRSEPLTEAERQKLNERIEADREAREAEQARKWEAAAAKAQAILDQAEPCQGHPYINGKGVQPCPEIKMGPGGKLLVPVLGPNGAVQSLQTISPDGYKKFLPGGKITGGFFAIGQDREGPLAICEGLATGLSLYEATGFTTMVAFNTGNLKTVAELARERYPHRAIIICGDDDCQTEGNPGRTKATEAARAVNGLLALPAFNEGLSGTDFNDLHQSQGDCDGQGPG